MKRFFIFLLVICLSANTFAQITKQQAADLVLNTIVENKIDSVNIEKENTIMPVDSLNIACFDVYGDSFYNLLTWKVPASVNLKEKLLSWSNGCSINAFAIGVPEDRDAAHRFTTDDIAEYVGWKVKKIGFVPLSNENIHAVKIWNKIGDEIVLIYEEELDNKDLVISDYNNGTWNYVEVKNDIYIEADKELWVGFSSDGSDYNVFPVDNGYDYKMEERNWYKVGNNDWEDLIPSKNFSIQAIIENEEGSQKNLYEEPRLTGYNVYANDILVKSIQEPVITYYLDLLSSFSDIQYCVTAVYGDVESEPLCIEYVSIDEMAETHSTLNVHPNPTNGKIMIENVNVNSVEIYNTQGQSVGRFNTNEIDMANLPSGMYILMVKDIEGNVNVAKVVRE